MVKHSGKMVEDYSEAYILAYQKMLNSMVQRRIRASILSVGSYWYSAWVDAGQPDLNKIISTPLTIAQKKEIEQEEALYKAGKILSVLK